jgi:hypothetical protein
MMVVLALRLIAWKRANDTRRRVCFADNGGFQG